MTIKLGVIMDPIGSINYKKDSTLAMLMEAQARGYALFYMEQTDLSVLDNQPQARMRPLTVKADPANWFELGEVQDRPLSELNTILMRKDPPFDMDYVFTTYLLELAEQAGVLVVNRPQSLRDANEKLYTLQFPQCMPPTLVSCNKDQLREFVCQHKDVILKPLEGMGGASIFRVREEDPNTNVIIETITQRGKRLIMAQGFIPEIAQGDKRILLVAGEAIPYALARIPPKGETRGNLAVGGEGVGVALTERDHWICRQVAPALLAKGLLFVGIDVIGDYLTEINVTSPTCIRELDKLYNLNISAKLFDAIEARLAQAG